ncbi:MAG: ABC transporter permease subunit, partial [Leifsonia sp.]
RVILTIFRGIPELVVAMLLIALTGFGAQPAIVALAIGGVGLFGKLIADSYEEVPAGPERALTAVGATRVQRFAAATWPQGLRALVGNGLYLLDTNIRAAAILGIVGAGGIGQYITNAVRAETLENQVPILVGMVMATVMVVEGLSQVLRRLFR